MGLEVMAASRVRRDTKSLFDRAVHEHLPVPMQRGTAERVFGLGAAELKFLVSVYEFHPEAMFEEDVSIWLPEFSIYGTGESYEEAKADLVEEVLDYVADYFQDATLRSAPNRRDHYPYALRAAVAAFDDQLEEVLFAQPREPARALS